MKRYSLSFDTIVTYCEYVWNNLYAQPNKSKAYFMLLYGWIKKKSQCVFGREGAAKTSRYFPLKTIARWDRNSCLWQLEFKKLLLLFKYTEIQPEINWPRTQMHWHCRIRRLNLIPCESFLCSTNLLCTINFRQICTKLHGQPGKNSIPYQRAW